MEGVEITSGWWRHGRFGGKASELVWMEEMGPRGRERGPHIWEKPRQGRAEARQACRADRCLGKGLRGRPPGDGAQRPGAGQSTAWPCGPQQGGPRSAKRRQMKMGRKKAGDPFGHPALPGA